MPVCVRLSFHFDWNSDKDYSVKTAYEKFEEDSVNS